MYDYDDDEYDDDPEPRELATAYAEPPGPCIVCGKAEQRYACHRCGKPICMDAKYYLADTSCGAWIMDWWSNGAMDPDDGNEFWCKQCLDTEKAKEEEEMSTSKRGFAGFSPEKRREISQRGGRSAHRQGLAHTWTSEEAKAAGRKGGKVSKRIKKGAVSKP